MSLRLKYFTAFLCIEALLLPTFVLPPVTAPQPSTAELHPVLDAKVVSTPKKVQKPKRKLTAAECLAQAMYFEAWTEGEMGMEAIAAVIFNRQEQRGYPDTVCGVVRQASQFAFMFDGKAEYVPARAWRTTLSLAKSFLAQKPDIQAQYGDIDHYHTIDVMPKWASSMGCSTTYGRHVFYSSRGSC